MRMRTRAHSLTSTPSSLIKQTRDKAMADVNENGPSEGENRKRKRRGFDTGLEDMTEMEQTGEVFMPSTLPKLNSDQRYNLSQAKKYCNELTSNFQQQKQSEYQVQQMQTLQEAANQQRALLLMCRIYIGSINFELGEESVRAGFSAFGTIKTVNMSWDSATMKHKGYAFIEFETAEAAQMALEQMSGVIIGGRNIKVGRPNNVPQAAPIIAAIQESAAKYPRIYIASIHPDLTAKDVKSVFEAFGKIKKVELAPDSVPGKHRGWGFIDYENHKSASDAIASMNLFDLGGQFLRVGRALTPPLPLYPPNAGPVLPSLLTSAALGYSNNSNSASPPSSRNNHPSLCIVASPENKKKGIVPPVATVTKTPASQPQPSLADIQAKLKTSNEEKEATNGGGTSDAANPNAEVVQLDEDFSISGSNARLMVMQRLSRKNESRVVVLRNMVSMEDVDDDLEEEVASECSRSGKVSNVLIHQEKKGQDEIIIKIFVSFTSPSEAEQTVKALNGRWFGGRVIMAEIYDQAKFDSNDLSQ